MRKKPEKVLQSRLNYLLEHGDGPKTIMALQGKSKVGKSTIDRIRNQAIAVKLDTLHALADAYGLSAAQLIEDDFDIERARLVASLDHDALEFAKAYQRLNADERSRFDALLILARVPASDEKVEAAFGSVPDRKKEKK